jgi:Leucine-rich repeat (LRR) protein
MTNLTYLKPDDTQISDLIPLAGLVNLTELFLDSNQLKEIVPCDYTDIQIYNEKYLLTRDGEDVSIETNGKIR